MKKRQAEKAGNGSWSWTIWIPPAIVGHSVGGNLNGFLPCVLSAMLAQDQKMKVPNGFQSV